MTSVAAKRVMFEVDWQAVDAELRGIARLRGPIDAREAVLLCSASRHEIWRNLGKASFLEYLEEVLGYTPKCARERVRVALALDTMPDLAEALETGELSYSAIRELTRVATPETEAAWRETARGKNVRQIEELVSVHAPGDQPNDPPRPDLKPHVVRFEISPATFARLRQVQQILADEHDGQLDDNALVEALCAAILDGGSTDADQGRARFQIMTTICESCSQGWQLGAGREIAINATDVAIAECDAQRIGSDREPGRAVQDVSPRVRRYVWRRDHGACQVPECRASRHLDVHHIVPRYLGGGHKAANLTVLCAGHHRSLHEGALVISGPAPKFTVTWTTTPHVGHEDESTPHVGHEDNSALHVGRETESMPRAGREDESTPHVGHAAPRHITPRMNAPRADVISWVSRQAATTQAPRVATGRSVAGPLDSVAAPSLAASTSHVGRSSKYERVVMKTEAIQALTQLGFRKPTARGLVEDVLAAAPSDLTLEQLLRDALQRSRSL